jgi:hypothetical protein
MKKFIAAALAAGAGEVTPVVNFVSYDTDQHTRRTS